MAQNNFVETVIIVAGIFTVITCIISVHHIRQHLFFNRNAQLRNYTVRILAMVPIYGIDSVLGMLFRDKAIGFSVFRECYESLALYSFFQYLVHCLGGKQMLAEMLRAKPQVHRTAPFNACLGPWGMGPQFLQHTSVGILQYVPIKLFCSLLAFICGLAGVYGAGRFDTQHAYPYIAFVVNCSQCWALYCLILFYLGTHEELEARNVEPLGKFLAIKLIIFFTWWQSVSIALAVHWRLIRAEHFVTCTDSTSVDCWTIDEIGESLNDVIICCEMLGFAVAHIWVFPVPRAAAYDALGRSGLEPQGCELK